MVVFDVIVPRCVLQCERIRMFSGFSQKCVPQTVKPGVGVGFDPWFEALPFAFPVPPGSKKRLAWISGVGEDVVTL